jgi:hypothetical protein
MALLKIHLAVSARLSIKESRFGDSEVREENAGEFSFNLRKCFYDPLVDVFVELSATAL